MKLLLLVPIVVLMSIPSLAADDVSTPPTGASVAWTSTEPLIVQAREMILTGRFAGAERLLADHATEPAAAETLEIIRRIRYDYPLSEADVYQKLRPVIRDLTTADIDRWTQRREIQYRTIDNELRYFRREPSNLFRFCPDAIARRLNKPAATTADADLIAHLKRIMDEANRTGREQVVPIVHHIKYALTVPANTPGAKAGSLVRAWLPFPQEYRQQSDVRLESSSPGKPVIAPNGSAHRTLYFEQRIDDPSKPITFEAVYSYTSHAYYPKLDDAKVQALPAGFDATYLAERPPHIRFSPKLKETVARVVGGETNPLAKARKLFHWVDATVRYHAEEEYTIIPAISEHCLNDCRGDCGVQGTFFITLCRAAGVPARWQSGWETRPDGEHNMHDWTEIYVAPWGWIPCDPSYGLKKSDDPAVREFYFGHQDSYRMIVNLDYGHPLTPAKQSLRSEPADFQRGEVEIDGRNLYFDQYDYDFAFTQNEPLSRPRPNP